VTLAAWRCEAGHITTSDLGKPAPKSCDAPLVKRGWRVGRCGRPLEPFTLRRDPYGRP
jgi:hypothetical protein